MQQHQGTQEQCLFIGRTKYLVAVQLDLILLYLVTLLDLGKVQDTCQIKG